ncbi:cell division protein ZapE [Pseudomonas sp. CFBP 13719]|uniref:cell division protein ZapE n=1 Tax=Pseudomonas sp. CFBP 13719 TaxID=2775303 RepID=UPI00406C573F
MTAPPSLLALYRRLFKPERNAQPGAATDPAGDALRAWFEERARQSGYTLGADQSRVIDSMAERMPALLQGTPASGLYLYGAVGRGKSWLLDGLFRAAPVDEKRRLHFHDFFARLHQGMFHHGQADDPLASTLDELLDNCRLLCFDEFHVHDIGDAMLITRLFKALFDRGILLVVTSNYPPEGLLPNPLYHERFLPVIQLINARMQVLEVGGATDYRSLAQSGAQQCFTRGHYVWPGTAAQRALLQLPPADLAPLAFTVGHRQLRARHISGERIHFNFADLCEEPTAVIDYLALCRRFDYWSIDHLPLLDDCSTAVQQRFINLIDVLYDQDKTLILVSERPLAESLAGSVIDLMRTRSRLGQLIMLGEPSSR